MLTFRHMLYQNLSPWGVRLRVSERTLQKLTNLLLLFFEVTKLHDVVNDYCKEEI